jgi:uncharacterized protein (DUF1810 family)
LICLTPNDAKGLQDHAFQPEIIVSTDPFHLQRFVDAQSPVIASVRAELSAGRKRSHWIWFVFPQIAGLGLSAMSQKYAIGSRGEAESYLAHPVLGPRLTECVQLVLGHRDRSAHDIFGSPDDQKLHSCLTLFDAVAPDAVFADALAAFFAGQPDRRTLALLG